MQKVRLTLIAVLTILLAIETLKLSVYEDYLIPRLIWSVETLYLNVKANRGMWKACKNFGYCDQYHILPQWKVIERKEYHTVV